MAKAHIGQAIDTVGHAPQVLFPLLFDRSVQLDAFSQTLSSGPTRTGNRPRVVYFSGPIDELPVMLVRRFALVVLPNAIAGSSHPYFPGQLLHCVWPNAELELGVRTESLWRQVCAAVYGLRQWRSTYARGRGKYTEHVTPAELATHFERASVLPSFVLPLDGLIPDENQREVLGRLFEKLARMPDVASGSAPTIFVIGSGQARAPNLTGDGPATEPRVRDTELSAAALSDFESEAVHVFSLPSLTAPTLADIGEWIRYIRGLVPDMTVRVDWPQVSDRVEHCFHEQGTTSLPMRAIFPVLVRTMNECFTRGDGKGTEA